MKLNEAILNLPESTLSVKKRVSDFVEKNPWVTLTRLDQDLMNMPLPQSVIDGMTEAVKEVSIPYGARLSGPWSGYAFLKTALVQKLHERGVEFSENEIFITSGLESAHACLSALFSSENRVLLTDPCEQSLPRLHLCAGRTLSFVRASSENGFVPSPDGQEADLVYLASPDPVTGVAMTRSQIKKWVDWANATGALIFFDSSLAQYLSPNGPYPVSPYEIEGARSCVVELFSFEKGYGVRELKIAQIVIPYGLTREKLRLHHLFSQRQPFTATPPSFIMQKAAELLLSEEAREQTEKLLHRIKKVERLLALGLTEAGLAHAGNETSPYLWVQCPRSMTSWQCFDLLLEKGHLVVTPGSLYGYGGEQYFRLTSFGLPEEAEEAVRILRELFLPYTESVPKKSASTAEMTQKLLFGE